MTYELAYSKAEKFFQTHSRLLETTRTKLVYNRLFTRHAVFFELLEVDYQGKSVLDLASHDGRWSLAALVAGASEVVGIEGREELVRDSEETVRTYGYSAPEISFHAGDILKTLRSMPKRKFDIVLNLGFFYHTIQHVEIVDELSRFEPDVMIIKAICSCGQGPGPSMDSNSSSSAGKCASCPALGLRLPSSLFINLFCFSCARISSFSFSSCAP